MKHYLHLIILVISYFFINQSVINAQIVNNDLGINDIIGVVENTINYECPLQHDIQVIVENKGLNDITSYLISYNINGNLTPYVSYNLLPVNGIDTVLIGSFIPKLNDTVQVQILGVNGQSDTMTLDNEFKYYTRKAMSGTFTIGKGIADFASLNDAIAAVEYRGVCGNVVFDIQPGEYRETLNLGAIPGVSDNNWVTFRSAANEGESVLINCPTHDDNNNDIHGVTLSNASYIRFENLMFDQHFTGAPFTFDLEGLIYFGPYPSNHIAFLGNKFFGLYSEITVGYYSISCSDVLFEDNVFEGGQYALKNINYGSISNLTLRNNTFKNQLASAIDIRVGDNILVEQNHFNKTVQIHGVGANVGNHVKFSKNHIIFKESTGLNLYAIHNLTLTNNIVAGLDINAYGVTMSGIDTVKMFFNTFQTKNLTQNLGTTTLHISNSYRIHSQNNAFISVGQQGTATSVQNSAFSNSDYNNYYATGGNLFATVSPGTLAAWQTYTLLDSNSVVGLPTFQSDTFLFVVNAPNLSQNGLKPMPNIDNLPEDDFQGNSRNSTVVDIGADEFTNQTGYDVGVVYINQEDSCGGSFDIKIRIKNYGTDTLTRAFVSWKVNGIVQNVHYWTGNLAPNDTSDLFKIGRHLFNSTGNSVEVWTFGDYNPSNDSLSILNFPFRMNGTYYIGSMNIDFLTFSEAMAALDSSGICGPVTFWVAPNTYIERVVLPEISGSSATNWIKFKSLGDSSNVILTDPGNATYSDLLTIDGADYVSFEGIQFLQSDFTNNNYKAVRIQNSANHLTFKRCYFRGRIISLDSKDDYLTFTNNRFAGNPFILKSINETLPEVGLVIENNIFDKYQDIGSFKVIDLEYQKNVSIRHNFFTQKQLNCITIYHSEAPIKVTNNTLQAFGGIGLFACHGSATDRILVANNFFAAIDETNTGHGSVGVSVDSSSYVDIFHNTIYANHLNLTSHVIAGIRARTYPSNHLRINNNIVVKERSEGYMLEVNSNGLTSCNNNIFYNIPTNTNIIRDGNTAMPFSQWQSSTGFDVNSVIQRPLFLRDEPNFDDIRDLHLSLNALTLPTSTFNTGVLVDIDGENRDTINPTIGADEGVLPANNAQITQMVNSLTNGCPGITPIELVIKNYGTANLTSLHIDWEMNGILQTPYVWTGNLAPQDSAIVTVGTYNITGATNLRTWSSLPNSQADEYPFLDTLDYDIPIGTTMFGTYTIGTNNADFYTITAAVNALITNGICAPVVLNIQDGVYEETVVIPTITGTSAQNTITFQSESLDTTAVTWKGTSNPLSTLQYTIEILNGKHLRFQYLTIEGAADTYYSTIHFIGGGNDVIINDNNLVVYNTSSGSLYHKVIETEGPSISIPYAYNDFKIYNNIIQNGYEGIDFQGNEPTGNSYGLEIYNNWFINQTNKGLLVQHTEAPIINHNKVEGEGNYGAYLNALPKMTLTNNYFYEKFLGLEIADCSGTSTNRTLIANNVISNPTNNYASSGMRLIVTTNADIYHNSVANHIANTGSSTSSIIMLNQSSNINIKNNTLTNINSYVLSFNSSTNIVSDYNNIYTTGTLGMIDNNTTFTNISAWQGFGYDVNSVSINPLFPDNTLLTLLNASLQDLGTPIATVTTDILGNARSSTTPEIGAYEYAVKTVDMRIVRIDNPTLVSVVGNIPVEATFQNLGTDTITNFTIGWSVNGVVQPAVSKTVNLLQGDLLSNTLINNYNFTIGTYDIKVWTTLPNGMIDQDTENDTLSFMYELEGMIGTYYIGTGGDFTTFNQAVNAMVAQTVVGPVIFRVYNGVYNEKVTIPNIIGASSLNTITFVSDVEDSTAVTLFANSTSSNQNLMYVINLDNAKHIRFKQLKIDTDNQYYVIALGGTVDDIVFENNIIDGDNTNPTGFANESLISVKHAANVQNILFKNNQMLNSHHAYRRAGTYANETNFFFDNNQFYNQRGTVFFFNDIHNFRIKGNYFKPQQVGNQSIYVYDCSGDIDIDNNYFDYNSIQQSFNQEIIWFSMTDGTASNPISVSNNYAIFNSAIGGADLFWFSSSDYINIYHNTLVIHNVSNTANQALRITQSNYVNYRNNILANFNTTNTTGNQLMLISSCTNCMTDHNLFYSASNQIEGTYTSLTALQAATGGYANCIETNPLFELVTQPHLSYTSPARNAATPILTVTTDIDNENRSTTMPDIGADEYLPFPLDIAMISVDSPINTGAYVFQNSVYATFENRGSQNITSVDFNWSVNNVLQTPMTWAGNLPSSMVSNSVLIGNFPFVGGSYDIKIWVNSINNGFDGYSVNDTIAANYTTTSRDLTIVSMDSPVSTPPYNTQSGVYVTVKNEGVVPITQAQINWSIDSVIKPAKFWLGNIMPGDSSISIYLGTHIFNQNKPYDIKIWTSMPNGQPDQNPSNDTLQTVFTPKAYDIVMSNITAPQNTPNFVLQNEVIIDFWNDGAYPLTNVTINWSINDTLQMPLNWSGLLANKDTAIAVTVGSYIFLDTMYNIKVWTTSPNGQADLIPTNDTLQFAYTPSPFGGTYVIGGGNSHFPTLGNAAFYINSIGMNKDVAFKINSGTYTERVSLNNINGLNANDTLLIQSLNQGSQDVTLTYSANSATDNYVLKLRKVAHVTVKDITIRSSATNYATLVDIREDVSNVLFQNNILYGSFNISDTVGLAATCVKIANGSDSLAFIDNIIFGNAYGIVKNTADVTLNQLLIKNNEISEQVKSGIVINNGQDIIIQNNRIQTTYFDYGYKAVELTGLANFNNISSNVFFIEDKHAILLKNSNNTSSQKSVIANNMVIISDEDGVGFELSNVNGYDVVYNTIHLNNIAVNATSTALTLDTVDDCRILNNLLTSKGSLIVKAANTSITNTIIDYNSYHTTGSAIAYWNGNLDSLSDWQSQSGFDQNSINVAPSYLSTIDLHINDTYAALDGKGTPVSTVLVDIDGDVRDILTPDIGADEYILTNVQNLNIENYTLTVFPNPSNGQFALKFDKMPNTNYQVRILTLDGKQIERKESRQLLETFIVKQSGVYFVEVTVNETIKTFKLIIR